MSQSRNWCFTLNNPPDDFELDNSRVRYSIYQLEKGSSGTPHIQGYVSFQCSKRLAAVRAYVPGAHWEIRQGTEAQASAYCSKDEGRLAEPVVFGTIARPGTRSDLGNAIATLDESKSLKRVAIDHPSVFVKYSRGLREYLRIQTSPTKPTTNVTFIYGPTSSGKCPLHDTFFLLLIKLLLGKSHYLRECYPDGYWKQNSIWWDDYEGQDVVIVDEFYGWLPFTEMLRLCDKYPLLLQTKGGQARAKFKKIYFTSNTNLNKMYDWDKPHINWDPFIRRFTQFMYFKSREEHLCFDNWNDFNNEINKQF